METNQNGKFWRSQIKPITADTLEDLEKQINGFCIDKFVISVDTYPILSTNFVWVAIIHYKIQPAP